MLLLLRETSWALALFQSSPAHTMDQQHGRLISSPLRSLSGGQTHFPGLQSRDTLDLQALLEGSINLKVQGTIEGANDNSHSLLVYDHG